MRQRAAVVVVAFVTAVVSMVSTSTETPTVVAAASITPTAPPPPIQASSPWWLTVLNAWRVAYGVQPVVENKTLSDGAFNHSCYVDYNRRPGWTANDYHSENPKLPGYTEAGAVAASGPQGPARVDEALRPWLESFFSALLHGADVLNPTNVSVGFGECDIDGDDNSWFTFNTGSDRRPTSVWTAPVDAMVFPPAATTWNFSVAPPESPDPTLECSNPNIRLDKTIGVPAMVTFRYPVVEPISATYTTNGFTLASNEVCVLYEDNRWDRYTYMVLVFPRYTDLGTQTVTVTTGDQTVSWSFTIPRWRGTEDGTGLLGALPDRYTPPDVTYRRRRPSGERSEFLAVAPFRFADSRPGSRIRATRLTAGVAQRFDIDPNITAVSANFTVANMAANGYLTAYDCSEEGGAVSTVNFAPGVAVANQAIIPTDTAGGICVYSNAATDIIIDINGYFFNGDLFPIYDVGRFTGIMPTRAYDTRPPSATNPTGVGIRLQAGVERTIPITDANIGVGYYANAIVVNVVAADTRAPGWLRLYPCGDNNPTGSTVNYRAFDVRANSAIVQLSAEGTICAESSTDIELIIDVNGYFSPSGSHRFIPVTPFRYIDTRLGTQTLSPPSLGWLDLTISGSLPDNAAGVVGNVTAVGAHRNGHLTIWPCRSDRWVENSRPIASNVNMRPPTTPTAAAGLLTPLGKGGGLCAYSSTTADIIIDINGYWVD